MSLFFKDWIILDGFKDICDEEKYVLTAGGHQTDLTWCDETLQQEDHKKKEENERAKQLVEAEKNKNAGSSITGGGK